MTDLYCSLPSAYRAELHKRIPPEDMKEYEDSCQRARVLTEQDTAPEWAAAHYASRAADLQYECLILAAHCDSQRRALADRATLAELHYTFHLRLSCACVLSAIFFLVPGTSPIQYATFLLFFLLALIASLIFTAFAFPFLEHFFKLDDIDYYYEHETRLKILPWLLPVAAGVLRFVLMFLQ